jgi:hypothetical protein
MVFGFSRWSTILSPNMGLTKGCEAVSWPAAPVAPATRTIHKVPGTHMRVLVTLKIVFIVEALLGRKLYALAAVYRAPAPRVKPRHSSARRAVVIPLQLVSPW